MNFNKFSAFLKQKGINARSQESGKTSQITANGTFADGSMEYNENSQIIFSSDDEKSQLSIMKKKRTIREFENEIPEINYFNTFLNFSKTNFFFSSSTVSLAEIALASAVYNSKENIEIKSDSDKEIFVSLIKNKKTKRISRLFTSAGKALDFDFLVSKKRGIIYHENFEKDYEVFCVLLPFVGLEQNPELPTPPYAYESAMPNEVFPQKADDALIQGIISLSKRIEEKEKETKKNKSSPLETARIELQAANEQIKQQIAIEIESLKRESTTGNALSDSMSELETSIAHKLNFGGTAAIPGDEAAALIRALI